MTHTSDTAVPADAPRAAFCHRVIPPEQISVPCHLLRAHIPEPFLKDKTPSQDVLISLPTRDLFTTKILPTITPRRLAEISPQFFRADAPEADAPIPVPPTLLARFYRFSSRREPVEPAAPTPEKNPPASAPEPSPASKKDPSNQEPPSTEKSSKEKPKEVKAPEEPLKKEPSSKESPLPPNPKTPESKKPTPPVPSGTEPFENKSSPDNPKPAATEENPSLATQPVWKPESGLLSLIRSLFTPPSPPTEANAESSSQPADAAQNSVSAETPASTTSPDSKKPAEPADASKSASPSPTPSKAKPKLRPPVPEIIVPSDPPEARQAREEIPDQEAIQALFLTESPLTLDEVIRRCAGLPGLRACALFHQKNLTKASNFPKEIDPSSLANLVSHFAGQVPTPSLSFSALTLHTDKGLISLIPHHHLTMVVLHAGHGFIPGVRERLLAILDVLIDSPLLESKSPAK